MNPNQEFPTFNLAAWRASANNSSARMTLAQSLTSTCHHTGFFLLTDHGVEAPFIDRIFDLSRQFFESPTELKDLMHKRHSPHFRGWESEGSEYTNGRPDIREQIDLWTEHPPHTQPGCTPYLNLLGPNQWPHDPAFAEFKPALGRWFQELGAIADELMQALAVGLGLSPGFFEQRFGEHRMSLTKLIRYPATPKDAFGVNAHHDAGFLTLLSPGTTPGLQIETADGSWASVPVIENTFVVNLGEIIQSMTNNYLLATPHRVIADSPRQSAAYFHGPSLDMPLDPIELAAEFKEAVANSPRHQTAGFMARREETDAGTGDMQSDHRPQVYGEQLWNYFVRSYPNIVEEHYPEMFKTGAS